MMELAPTTSASQRALGLDAAPSAAAGTAAPVTPERLDAAVTRARQPAGGAGAVRTRSALRPGALGIAAPIAPLLTWIRTRSARERRTLGACVWLAAAGLVFNACVGSAKALQAAQSRASAFAASAQQQTQVLAETRQAERSRATEIAQQIAGLLTQRREAAQTLGATGASMPEPAQVLSLVRSLIDKRPALKLIELRTLPSQMLSQAADAATSAASAAPPRSPVAAAAASAAASAAAAPLAALSAALAPPPAPALYEHPMEVAVAGSFAALLDFAASLRGVDIAVVWDAVQLRVDEHPQCVLLLRMHVVTRSPSWLPSGWGS